MGPNVSIPRQTACGLLIRGLGALVLCPVFIKGPKEKEKEKRGAVCNEQRSEPTTVDFAPWWDILIHAYISLPSQRKKGAVMPHSSIKRNRIDLPQRGIALRERRFVVITSDGSFLNPLVGGACLSLAIRSEFDLRVATRSFLSTCVGADGQQATNQSLKRTTSRAFQTGI